MRQSHRQWSEVGRCCVRLPSTCRRAFILVGAVSENVWVGRLTVSLGRACVTRIGPNGWEWTRSCGVLLDNLHSMARIQRAIHGYKKGVTTSSVVQPTFVENDRDLICESCGGCGGDRRLVPPELTCLAKQSLELATPVSAHLPPLRHVQGGCPPDANGGRHSIAIGSVSLVAPYLPYQRRPPALHPHAQMDENQDRLRAVDGMSYLSHNGRVYYSLALLSRESSQGGAVDLPACTHYTYDDHTIDTLSNSRIPKPDTLIVRNEAWSKSN